LDLIEAVETDLLTWGIVDAELTDEELDSLLREAVGEAGDPRELRSTLLDEVLVVQTPSGGFRSRMAETLRILSRLRQVFPYQHWWEGAPLVLDYRFAHRSRHRPRRNVPVADLVTSLSGRLGAAGVDATLAMAPALLSGFQVRSSRAVVDGLSHDRDAGVMISAGTGSGKTLAFYLPTLAWIAQSMTNDTAAAVRLLALYPRGELLKDQLRAVLQLSRRIGLAGGRPLRVGTWFGLTPRAAFWLKQGWAKGWKEVRHRGRTEGWECPFLSCPECGESLIWRLTDIDARRERLYCTGCRVLLDESYITLTRDRASADPPDIMFTTTESLNRQLAAPDQYRAFGIGDRRVRAVLLDEIHTYEGTTGAQNALLLRRLRRALRGPVLWAGLSATLQNPEEFLAEFATLYGDRISHIAPVSDELEEAGAEYLVALRHDPGSLTGPLSTTIQATMALARALDAPGTPYQPVPTSHGLFGRKVFVFTDKLDVTNRLYWDLLDAEGWWERNRPKNRRILTLAHLRAEQQSRRDPVAREGAPERDAPGQWWWLAERLGRDLDGDEQLVVGRTSSQDAGVDEDADVIVATATLEVGYDDPAVGAVLQHKAPHDLGRFVQRRGRAGRDPSMRPWTVVVLSDWGRDRVHWELYDQLFDPQLQASHLPLRNRYVLRMQAVYATLDWLGSRLSLVGQDRSAWADLAAPASILETSAERVRNRSQRQAAGAELLREVLDGGPAREHLRSHLRRSLGFSDDEFGWAELDAILWSPPRPLMLAVLPTALRRLRTSWAGEEPSRDDVAVRTRTPLREFIVGNLFDDLLLPEVEILVPTGTEVDKVESALLPAIRTLRELMPGNVTRHFGVSSFSRRHWVPLPEVGVINAGLNIRETYGAEYIGPATATRAAVSVDLYRPTMVRLAVPPDRVRDASAVHPRWDYEITPLGTGQATELARNRWTAVISRASFHIHAVGGGVRVRRFAIGASGSLFSGAAPQPVTVDFEVEESVHRQPVLGIEFDADGLLLELQLPVPSWLPTPAERSARLASVMAGDPALPSVLTWFQRSAIASALTVVAVEAGRDFAQVLGGSPDSALAESLISALGRLGLLVAADPHALDVGDEAEVASNAARHAPQPMEQWCRHQDVLSAARRAVTRAAGPRDPEWCIWLQRRLAATVATTFIEAACLASNEMTSDDLAIDVAPAQGERLDVWISETSPGGNGQIEHLQRVITEDPQRFGRLVERSLALSDLEALDADVRAFIAATQRHDALRQAGVELQGTWRHGNHEVARAFAALRERTRDAALRPSRAAWTTIVNRLLGPGSHPLLTEVVASLLHRWDTYEREIGLAISAREFGALCHADESLDAAFRIGALGGATLRSRTVGNFFWPRSIAVRLGMEIGDPFGLLPETDRAALRAYLPARSDAVAVATWDDATRTEVHARLRKSGTIDLWFADGGAKLARRVVLRLQDDPVDATALFLYPVVVGTSIQADGTIVVSLALPEIA
jgi:hypothetical protein